MKKYDLLEALKIEDDKIWFKAYYDLANPKPFTYGIDEPKSEEEKEQIECCKHFLLWMRGFIRKAKERVKKINAIKLVFMKKGWKVTLKKDDEENEFFLISAPDGRVWEFNPDEPNKTPIHKEFDISENSKKEDGGSKSTINQEDPRCHSADARWQINCLILKALREKKLKKGQIAQNLGVHNNHVTIIANKLKANKNLTYEDLKEKKRGPSQNPFNVISADVYAEMIIMLTTKLPRELGINYSTWTCKAILEWLEKSKKVVVTEDYLYYFLNRMNITSKFAERVNPQRDEEKVQGFLNHKYRKICLKSLINGAELVFVDEVHVQCGNHVRGFAPKGMPAIMEFSNNCMHSTLSLLVFVGIEGFFRVFIMEDGYNAETFKKYLKTLKKENPGKKFHFLLDNARVHHAKIVRTWIKHHKGGGKCMDMDFIPAYCPDLNVAERWNNIYKTYMRNTPCRKEHEMKTVTEKFIEPYNKGSKTFEIKNLFLDQKCVYSLTEYCKAQSVYNRYIRLFKKVG